MVDSNEKPNDIKDLAHDPTMADPTAAAAPSDRPKAVPKLGESFAAWRGAKADGLATVDKSSSAALGGALSLPRAALVDALAPELDPVRKFLALSESPRTAQTMAEGLARIGALYSIAPQDVAWHQLRRLHTTDMRLRLQRAYSPRTVNVTLCALRGVLRCAWEDELMTGEEYTRAIGVKNMKVRRLPKGRWLGEDTKRVLDHCRALGPTAKDWPGSAFGSFLLVSCALMFAAGLRASEVACLTVNSYDRRTKELRFIGKGGDEAIVPLGDEVIGALEEWLSIRAELDLGEGMPLIVRVRKDGSVNPRTALLNRRKLEHLCKQIARKALGEKFSPHDLRRTFCTDILDRGTDLATAQRLMRHKSPATTVLYDRRPIEADAAARRKMNLFERKPSDEGKKEET
jgi:site-specific recombinase XerD